MSSVSSITRMLLFAKETALAAGELLLDQQRTLLRIEQWDRHDVKLEADQAAESLVLERIRAEYDEHAIISEESLAAATAQSRSRYTWVVDPLDGTRNYAAGIPYYGVSIAILDNLEPLVGVVYVPCTADLFWAVKGGGAYCSGVSISVSRNHTLQKAKLSVGWGQSVPQIQKGVYCISHLAHRACFTLVNYAPALDLCNIARGLLDGLIDCGTEVFDHAAGGLILQEAGGSITGFDGQAWRPFEVGIVGSNPGLHRLLCSIARRSEGVGRHEHTA